MWEKISDYCLDVSKYFLTAVFAAALLDDLGDNHWLLYTLCGLLGGGLFALACSLIRYLIRKRFKNVENIENTIIINGGNDMNVIAFLVTFIVTFSIIFAFLLSSKGQKWMNEYN